MQKTIPPEWIDKKPEVRNLKKWEASWVAGILDSDGSVGRYDYGKEGTRVQVQFANVCKPFLERIRETIGCGSCVLHIPSVSHKGRQPMFNYTVKGSCRCYWLLRQLIPYLVVKRERAEKIMAALEARPFGRWAARTDSARRRMSRLAKKSWANPEIRKRRLDGMRWSGMEVA